MLLLNCVKTTFFRHFPKTTQLYGIFHRAERNYRCLIHGDSSCIRLFLATGRNHPSGNNGQHRQYRTKKVAEEKTHDVSHSPQSNTSLIASIIARKEIGRHEKCSLEGKDIDNADENNDRSLRSLSEEYDNIKKDLSDFYSTQSVESAEFTDEEEPQNSSFFVEELTLDDHEGVAPKVRKVKGVRSIYGTADPSIPFSEVPCAGCGATLHCQNTAIPGYMPKEKFLSLTQRELKRMLCQKCFLMTYNNFCLNVRATPAEYAQLISDLRYRKGLIVLVVDLTDITNSMIKCLPQLVGEGRKYFVIGTKVDLLPGVPSENLHHCQKVLLDWCMKSGLGSHGSTIEHVSLVSAKTGYGIEELVNKLLKRFNHAAEGNQETFLPL